MPFVAALVLPSVSSHLSAQTLAGGIGIYWRPADYGRVARCTYIAW
jgi:hypothetical protein